MAIVGAMSEVATLKQVLFEAEKRAATERIEWEKYEARLARCGKSSRLSWKNMRVWSVTRRLESPSSPWLLRVPKPLRPKPRRPSRRSRR